MICLATLHIMCFLVRLQLLCRWPLLGAATTKVMLLKFSSSQAPSKCQEDSHGSIRAHVANHVPKSTDSPSYATFFKRLTPCFLEVL